jgi:hypothetical protein
MTVLIPTSNMLAAWRSRSLAVLHFNDRIQYLISLMPSAACIARD